MATTHPYQLTRCSNGQCMNRISLLQQNQGKWLCTQCQRDAEEIIKTLPKKDDSK